MFLWESQASGPGWSIGILCMSHHLVLGVDCEERKPRYSIAVFGQRFLRHLISTASHCCSLWGPSHFFGGSAGSSCARVEGFQRSLFGLQQVDTASIAEQAASSGGYPLFDHQGPETISHRTPLQTPILSPSPVEVRHFLLSRRKRLWPFAVHTPPRYTPVSPTLTLAGWLWIRSNRRDVVSLQMHLVLRTGLG